MSQAKKAVSSVAVQEKDQTHIVRHAGLLFLAFLLLISVSLVLSLRLLDSIPSLRIPQGGTELQDVLVLGHILVACCSLLLVLSVGKSLLHRSQQRYQAEQATKQMAESLEERIQQRTEDLLGYIKNTELIFSSTLDGIIEVDDSGVILFINKAGAQMSGYGEGDWLIHAFQDSSAPSPQGQPAEVKDGHSPDCNCPLCSATNTNENSRFSEIPLRCKGGDIIYVDGSIAPVIQDGKPNGAIFVFHNISEYSKMESLQQAIFESSTEPFLIFSPRKLSSCNSAAVKFFGVENAEELCGNFLRFSSPSQDGTPSDACIERNLNYCEQYGTIRMPWIHCHADGTQIPCSISISKMEHPLYKGFLASITDLRTIQRYEAKLQEDRDLLNTIINASPMPMYLEDQDGLVTVINPAAERLLPLHIGSQGAKAWVEQDGLKALREQVWAGKPVCEHSASLRSRHADKCLETRTSIFNVVYEGESASLFWVQDVSDIMAAKEQAEKYSLAKGEFLARMSHEIRTPMNAILGMTYLFVQNPLEDWQKRYILKIQDAAKGLLGIINDILDFSKIEAGKMDLDIAPFTLSELVEGVNNVCNPMAEDKRVELLFHIYPNMPDVYEGDMLRLSQILINLISNAVKFTESGEVVLRISELEHHNGSSLLSMEVYDTGIGMDEEQLSRLFQSFEQADSSTTRKYGGTGLGLYICKQLSRMMGGDISARSKVGVGSIFSVQVPLGSQYSEHSAKRRKLATKERVLVVDDNEAAQSILCDMISGFGFQVDSVASGQEACGTLFWAATNGSPYAIAILDWKMPGMDGFECARLISELPLGTMPKLLMVSACGLEEYNSRGKNFGFVDYIPKPVTPSSLFNGLAKAMGMEHLASLRSKKKQGQQAVDISAIKGSRVLLVEDNETNREVASKLLQGLGMAVEHATSGLEAVTLCTARPYDLVFMDIQMPIMDGLEATRRIRAAESANATPSGSLVPIIAMTAHARESDRAKSLEAGMNDHITKPIDPDMLCTALLKWIPARSAPGTASNPVMPFSDTPFSGTSSPVTPFPGAPALPAPIPELSVRKPSSTLPPGLSSAQPPAPEKIPFVLNGVHFPHALHNLGGDLESLIEHLQRFPSRYSHYAKLLREHVGTAHWEDAARIAHTLKGVSATLGMDNLSHCAARLEDYCTDKSVTAQQMDELDLVLARLCADIQTNVPNPGPAQGPAQGPAAMPNLPTAADKQTLCNFLSALPRMLESDVGECMSTLNTVTSYVPSLLKPDSYKKLHDAVYACNTALVNETVRELVTELKAEG